MGGDLELTCNYRYCRETSHDYLYSGERGYMLVNKKKKLTRKGLPSAREYRGGHEKFMGNGGNCPLILDHLP